MAVNLFHLRDGKDRRPAGVFLGGSGVDFDPAELFSSLLKQIYIDQQYIPALIHVPVDFEDREALEE